MEIIEKAPINIGENKKFNFKLSYSLSGFDVNPDRISQGLTIFIHHTESQVKEPSKSFKICNPSFTPRV
jgi:hypothetical protein